MSEASERGKAYEQKISKITAKKLRLEMMRDSRSGAGWVHKEDIRDRYNEIPLAIEIKDHETLKPKEWWRDADQKASFGQSPVVVFPMETEDLCIMRYTDLLQIIREMMDYKEEVADLRKPLPPASLIHDSVSEVHQHLGPSLSAPIARTAEEVAAQVQRVAERRTQHTCREGHLADDYGMCMQKGCKYSRGYKAKKEPKK